MSRADGILDFVVKTAPFRDLKSGFKPEEYRADKPGKDRWGKRLVCDNALRSLRLRGLYLDELFCSRQVAPLSVFMHPYHTARISLGYQADRETFYRKIRRIRWGAPNPAWTYGIITSAKCFVIELGDLV